MSVRWGLKGRAIALCILLVLATAAALGVSLLWQSYRNDIKLMSKSAVVYAQTISHLAEPAVLLNDRVALQRVAEAAAAYSAVCRGIILDAAGHRLACFQRSTALVPAAEIDWTDPQKRLSIPQDGYLQRTDTQLVAVVPILRDSPDIELGLLDDGGAPPPPSNVVLGYVDLTYSLEQIRDELASRMLSSTLLAALVIALGTGATLLAVRTLLLPLRDLVRVTAAIAQGDRTQRASENAVGEIGELARSFNHMADCLQESYNSIEQKVAQRTIELEARERELVITNRALEAAMAAAQAASRAKSEFLANMSHEIRTPMTAILGFADVLLEQGNLANAPPERMEAAKTIKSNGEHLLGIINDILDLSKIEAGKMTIEEIVYAPCRLVAEVASLMRVRAKAKGLPLEIEYERPIPETIRTDPTRLRQILVNVVANAIKFTETGTVRLITRLKPDDGQPRLEFDVVDTGVGMTQEQVVRLFQPFMQADASTTRQFGGTGLGLAISRRLAQMLKGDIAVVATQPGAGTRFRVTVATGSLEGVGMLDDPAAATTLAGGSHTDSAMINESHLSGCRILLAEDGPDNQRLISHLLKKAGAAVIVVGNGKLACEAALAARDQGRSFDLVLMDMQMPVLDGYSATGRLRRAGYDGPIIALTAHAMEGDREKCLQAGCDDYAAKPIVRAALLATIRRHRPEASPAGRPT